jgi:disulfide bond formation protein DsbB
VAKSLKDVLVPILFLVEGAFWLGIVATGGGPLLILAALSGILSGVLLLWRPSNWVSRPLAGASALFGLALTVYQAYEASTLLASNLSTLGVESAGIFVAFAVVYVYLEMATLSVGRSAEPMKKA